MPPVYAVLLDQGMIFAYFKDLAPYVDLPGELLDKEIVEYRGAPEGRPVLMVRVLPDEEEFHEEELKPVYKGIYVRQKLLFEGEVMEYTISEYENGEPVEKASGQDLLPGSGRRGPGKSFFRPQYHGTLSGYEGRPEA